MMTMSNNIEKGNVHIYVSPEGNRTAAAFGRALLEAAEGKQISVVFFEKNKVIKNPDFWKKMEPELKLFSFEDIQNGINFTRKVLATEGCDLLLLTDVTERIRDGSMSLTDLKGILEAQGQTDIILTGKPEDEIIFAIAQKVYRFGC